MANTSAKTIDEYLDGNLLFKFDNTSVQIIPQTDDILNMIRTIVTNIFQGNIDLSEETPIGRLVEAWALTFSRFCAITATYANQINPAYATGQALDAIASIFNVSRHGATNTVINIKCNGLEGTVIPSGSEIKNNAGQRFIIDYDMTLNESGESFGTATSVDSGIMTVVTGSVNKIVDTKAGWIGVADTGISSLGSDIESDASLRDRVLNSRWTGTAFLTSIEGAVRKVKGVHSTYLIENVESDIMYFNKDKEIVHTLPESGRYIELAPHSICAIVLGSGVDTDENIANAIFNSKSAGCGYTAISEEQKVEQAVTDSKSGIMYNVIFNHPSQIVCDVEVTAKKNLYPGTEEQLKNDIKDAITKWSTGSVPFVDGMQLGQSIYAFEIGAAISDVIPTIQIIDVKLKVDDEYKTSVDVFVDEVGVINDVDVTVV